MSMWRGFLIKKNWCCKQTKWTLENEFTFSCKKKEELDFKNSLSTGKNLLNFSDFLKFLGLTNFIRHLTSCLWQPLKTEVCFPEFKSLFTVHMTCLENSHGFFCYTYTISTIYSTQSCTFHGLYTVFVRIDTCISMVGHSRRF